MFHKKSHNESLTTLKKIFVVIIVNIDINIDININININNKYK